MLHFLPALILLLWQGPSELHTPAGQVASGVGLHRPVALVVAAMLGPVETAEPVRPAPVARPEPVAPAPAPFVRVEPFAQGDRTRDGPR